MKRKALKYSSIVAGIAFLAVFFGMAIANTPETEAISAMDFRAGNIIDDDVFYDKSTMSVADIQNHLNRYMPACDTWGTGAVGSGRYINGRAVPANTSRADYARQMRAAGKSRYHDPPYICVQNYYENPSNHRNLYDSRNVIEPGMISAAQIIYNASQKYNVNPQVLLVLLKKESYVWGDNWPLRDEYNTVMGYACPDTAPCNSKYFGFYNQVEMAAWQLKYYKEHIYSYNYRPYATNSILYSPDASCGRKSVYLENMATTSLYIYTPYTPNDAALRNYPGTAPCGSYGNRNFFMYFSEWFGDTHAPAASKKIQAKYEQLGGEAYLGKQITGTRLNTSTGIYYRQYEKGYIVGNDRFGYHESSGKIRDAWGRKSYEAGPLGFPIGDVYYFEPSDITVQQYEHGYILGNDKVGYHASYGKIRDTWGSLNNEFGPLGLPTGEVYYYAPTNITVQQYEHGHILGNDKVGYHASYGEIRETWGNLDNEYGPLGLPIGEVYYYEPSNITLQQYEHGFILGNDKVGYHASYGKIRDVWAKQNYEYGPLGLPIGEVYYYAPSNITVQQYEHGFILGNDKVGYHASYGKIREAWGDQNYEYGPLGLPIGEVYYYAPTNITVQQYEHGFILGNDKVGYHASYGKIREAWAKQNYEYGPLGLPIGEVTTTNNITFQQYENGYILGNDKVGYHASYGKIREAWAKQSFESGPLGLPIGEVYYYAPSNITVQQYEHGFILGNDKVGYHASYGKIREAWAKQNYEFGKMGLPTGDVAEYNGIIFQTYEHGTIYYNPQTNSYTWIQN